MFSFLKSWFGGKKYPQKKIVFLGIEHLETRDLMAAGLSASVLGNVLPKPPVAPSFTAATVSPTQINLAWHSVPSATGYLVDEWSNGGWKQIESLGSASTGVSINGLSPNTTSYFDVAAKNAFGATWATPEQASTSNGVVAADGSVWFLGSTTVDSAGDHAIYQIKNGRQTQLPGSAIALGTAQDTVFVLNAAGQVSRWNSHGWSIINALEADDGSTWFAFNHDVYRFKSGQLSQMPGSTVTSVWAQGGMVFMMDTANHVFVWNGQSWIQQIGVVTSQGTVGVTAPGGTSASASSSGSLGLDNEPTNGDETTDQAPVIYLENNSGRDLTLYVYYQLADGSQHQVQFPTLGAGQTGVIYLKDYQQLLRVDGGMNDGPGVLYGIRVEEAGNLGATPSLYATAYTPAQYDIYDDYTGETYTFSITQAALQPNEIWF